ncbi:MAG: hypothetical protein N2746_00620 [Deltaproteobacteria bacterium]|nr:hypothetical protein [Deltaproteobacteria bacterium]
MRLSRFFLVFFISLTVFSFFIIFVLHSLFYTQIVSHLKRLQYQKLKKGIYSVEVISKYDLQNIVLSNEYKPSTAIFKYDKKNNNIYFLQGKDLFDRRILGHINTNIKKIVFLEDGYGYIFPLIVEKEVYLIVALERGDNIFLSVESYTNDDPNISLCLEFVGNSHDVGQSNCKGGTVYEKRFFNIRYNYAHPLGAREVILSLLLFILVAVFFAYWISGHFSLEEKKIISEIQDSIEAIMKGFTPFINVRSIYPLYNELIEQINNLILAMNSEINKYKVVYEKHFKEGEGRKAETESINGILNIFTGVFSKEEYQNLLKSFDLLFKKYNGSLRFIGFAENIACVKRMVFVLLDLLHHKKGYHLIVEVDRDKIYINSENIDFEGITDNSPLYNCTNISYEPRRIIIY